MLELRELTETRKSERVMPVGPVHDKNQKKEAVEGKEGLREDDGKLPSQRVMLSADETSVNDVIGTTDRVNMVVGSLWNRRCTVSENGGGESAWVPEQLGDQGTLPWVLLPGSCPRLGACLERCLDVFTRVAPWGNCR